LPYEFRIAADVIISLLIVADHPPAGITILVSRGLALWLVWLWEKRTGRNPVGTPEKGTRSGTPFVGGL